MGNREYIGLTLDGTLLKIARIRKQRNQWSLTQLNRINIKDDNIPEQRENRARESVKNYSEDYHFGLDSEYDEVSKTESDFEFLNETEGPDESTTTFHSNVLALKYALEQLERDKIRIGISIRSGDSSFQVLKDRNYSKLSKKKLKRYVESHLKKVYGEIPSEDYYKYEVRDNGSLLLISYQEKPYLLKLLDHVRHLYDGKIKIMQMLPDEYILAALVQKNYHLEKDEITCVIHMGFNRSRVFFMQGDEIIHTLVPIEEGREADQVLDVIFSKILFQLDTGEVPGLDRILITNNDLNEESVTYFRKQFPDLIADEFQFNPDLLQMTEDLKPVSRFFTSAIGAALTAANIRGSDYSTYSMLPSYITERQNMLKLRWHGLVLLVLLLITPLVWNQMYQQKNTEIYNLEEEITRTEYGIANLEAVIQEAEQIQELYRVERDKMDLLTNLGEGITYWSETLKTLNDGLVGIKSTWIDRIQYGEDGFTLQGYSMIRENIPQVTNLFSRSDLQAVSVVEMRGVRLYKFSIKVYYEFNNNLNDKFQISES